MDAATIIALIEQGLVLVPKFEEAWAELSATFSSGDAAAIQAALNKAKAQDAQDTAQMDADADAATAKE